MSLQDAYSDLHAQLDKFSTEAEVIFRAADWRWSRDDGMRPPTKDEIASVASSLIWDSFCSARRSGCAASISGGRIQARFVYYDNHWIGALELVACVKHSYCRH